MMTFGETRRFLKLAAWMFLDSFAASIPFGVMMIAVFFC